MLHQRWKSMLLHQWKCTHRHHQANIFLQRWSNIGINIHHDVAAMLEDNVNSIMEVHAQASSVQRCFRRWYYVVWQQCSNVIRQCWSILGINIHYYIASRLLQQWRCIRRHHQSSNVYNIVVQHSQETMLHCHLPTINPSINQ